MGFRDGFGAAQSGVTARSGRSAAAAAVVVASHSSGAEHHVLPPPCCCCRVPRASCSALSTRWWCWNGCVGREPLAASCRAAAQAAQQLA
jgi:hypothetical protein